MISAIILAAGYGVRAGKPKLMLEAEGKSFLSIITENLSKVKIDKIICVVNEQSYEWAVREAKGIEFVINPHPENGMLSSVLIGFNKCNDSNGLLIIPVDHPFVNSNTYQSIIDAFYSNSSAVIKPVYNEKSGHPVLIPSELLNNFNVTDIDGGLNKIIKDSGAKTINIDVSDSGVTRNINYINDL